MATQTASPTPAPTAKVVGNAFVEQYYHILHHSPELVYRFYQDNSVLSRPDPNGLMVTVTAMNSINKTICSLDYQNYKAEIKTADSQESYENGVVVLVTGSLTGKDNLKRKFTQTFFLAPQDKGYYVCNDVFRYVEETEFETTNGVVATVEDTPSTSITRDPEPTQVVDPPNVNHEPSRVEEVETVEQKSNDELVGEREASDEREYVVEAESRVNENHVSAVVAELVTPTAQEDAPKKSYASILSSQTKKGPTKIYVPTNAAKVDLAKTAKPSVNPVEQVSASEASVPSAPINASESKDLQDEDCPFPTFVHESELHLSSYDVKEEQCSSEGPGKYSKIFRVIPMRRKLIVLDVNGLLAHIIMPSPKDRQADTRILGRAIFKRPFCDDFLNFCFQNFDVGIWSSRSKAIIDRIADYLLGNHKGKILFCWNMSQATQTGFRTLENNNKPLVFKELRKIWENNDPGSRWKNGDYDESNTLLLDDSPYKALLNPLHTAIFPRSYNYGDIDDNSLGPGGDLRVYLEGLLESDSVQKYVEQKPFGQCALDERNPSWEFYSRVLQTMTHLLRVCA